MAKYSILAGANYFLSITPSLLSAQISDEEVLREQSTCARAFCQTGIAVGCPELGLLCGSLVEERQARYLRSWLKARDPWYVVLHDPHL